MDQSVSHDVHAKDAPLSSGIKFKVAEHDAMPVQQRLSAPLNKEDALKSVWRPVAVKSNVGASTFTTCKGECIFLKSKFIEREFMLIAAIRNISVIFRDRYLINEHIPSTQEWVCTHRFTGLQQPSRPYHQVFPLPKTALLSSDKTLLGQMIYGLQSFRNLTHS